MKALLVIDESIFPSRNGSGAVYKAWLNALRNYADYVGLIILSRGDDYGGNDPDILKKEVPDSIVVPAEHSSPVFKLIRSFGRSLTEGLFAPTWMEGLGRKKYLTQISGFIEKFKPDVIVIQKLSSFILLGELDYIKDKNIIYCLDVHDDFVIREALERLVLDSLLNQYPVLLSFDSIRKQKLRYNITRFNPEKAAQQELSLLSKINILCVASDTEVLKYNKSLEGNGNKVHLLNWGFNLRGIIDQSDPVFHAGIIASDAIFNLEGILYFIKNLMPKILEIKPSFRLLIAGSSAKVLLAMDLKTTGIDFMPWVDNLTDFYGTIQLALVPLYSGTGVSIKTIEAISYAIPLVVTPTGVRGLGNLAQEMGKDVCNGDEQFIQTVMQKINGFVEAKEKAILLRERFIQYYSLQAFSQQVGALFRNVNLF